MSGQPLFGEFELDESKFDDSIPLGASRSTCYREKTCRLIQRKTVQPRAYKFLFIGSTMYEGSAVEAMFDVPTK